MKMSAEKRVTLHFIGVGLIIIIVKLKVCSEGHKKASSSSSTSALEPLLYWIGVIPKGLCITLFASFLAQHLLLF